MLFYTYLSSLYGVTFSYSKIDVESVSLTYCESLRIGFAMEMCVALNPPQKLSEVGSAETPSLALSLRWTSTATLWKRLGHWLMTLKRRWL